MKVTVVARPLPSARWVLQATESPTAIAVVGTLDGADEELRSQIASLRLMEVAEIDVQLDVELAARVIFDWHKGDWVAEVPLVPGFFERTDWFDDIPTLIGDKARSVLNLDDDALVDVTVDVVGPFFVSWSDESHQYIAGIHDTPAPLCAADTADDALRAVRGMLLAAEPDSPRAGVLRDMTAVEDTPEEKAWLRHATEDARTEEPGAGYTTEQVRAHIAELSAHTRRRQQLASTKPTVEDATEVEHPTEGEDPPECVDEPPTDAEDPMRDLGVDSIYDALTSDDRHRKQIVFAAVKADEFGIVALNVEAALARGGVDARTRSMAEGTIELARTGGQSLLDVLQGLPAAPDLDDDDFDLSTRDRCGRLHVDDVRTAPGVALHLETGRVTITIEGGEFCSDGATLDEALTEMVSTLRDYAAEWHTRLHIAPIHGDREHWIHFLEKSSANEIRYWLLPTDRPSKRTNLSNHTHAEADRERTESTKKDMRARLEPVAPGDVLTQEFMEPRGLSPEDLAVKSGLTIDRIAGIIAGEVPLERADTIALAAALGTSATFWRTMQRRFDDARRP